MDAELKDARVALKIEKEAAARMLASQGYEITGRTLLNWEVGRSSPQPLVKDTLLRLYREVAEGKRGIPSNRRIRT